MKGGGILGFDGHFYYIKTSRKSPLSEFSEILHVIHNKDLFVARDQRFTKLNVHLVSNIFTFDFLANSRFPLCRDFFL